MVKPIFSVNTFIVPSMKSVLIVVIKCILLRYSLNVIRIGVNT